MGGNRDGERPWATSVTTGSTVTDQRTDHPAGRRPAKDGLSRLQRLTYRVWLAIGVLMLLAATLVLLYQPLAVIIAPLLVALLIIYLLDPVVTWLERHGVPRLAGTSLAYLLVLGVAAGGAAALFPSISAQLEDFAADVPELGEALVTQIETAADRLGLDIDPETLQLPALIEQTQAFAAEAENRELMLALLGGLSGLARGALFVLTALLLGPIVAFYALVDLPNLRRMSSQLLPPRHREEGSQLAAKLGRVVGGFVRGQLVIAVAIGVATSVGLAVVGLPYWLLVGVVAGIANVIPLLGPLVAGVLGALIALLSEGLGFAVLVAVIMTAVQQIDGQMMSPLIFGRTVRLHPLAVLLGLLVAGSLYGIFGMLVVVPVIAGAKAVLQHFWETRVPWGAASADDVPAPAADEPGRALPTQPALAAPDRPDGWGEPATPTGADDDGGPSSEGLAGDGAPAPR